MKVAYLDLFCGLSGDITLGTLVDAGLPLAELRRGLARLPLKGYTLAARRIHKGSLAATKVDVVIPHPEHAHTSLKSILALIKRSGLPAPVKEKASEAFVNLGRAEGRVHGVDPAKAHLHEAGDIDSIVDIVGSCLGMHLLGIEKVYCSRVPVSRGEIPCHHGVIPNPGPAAAQLLKGFPLTPIDIEGEVVTPTGATLLATLVSEPGVFPEMRLEAIGTGAGDFTFPGRANIARIWIGEAVSPEESDAVYLIETNLDDVPGQLVGYLFEKLFAVGAVDVYTTPIQMKKSRPAVKLSVLVPPSRRVAVESLLLRETPTFGVRRVLMERTKLDREMVSVRTPYGPIRCKAGSLGGKRLKVAPEYEDVRAAAHHHNVPFTKVLEAAHKARKGK